MGGDCAGTNWYRTETDPRPTERRYSADIGLSVGNSLHGVFTFADEYGHYNKSVGIRDTRRYIPDRHSCMGMGSLSWGCQDDKKKEGGREMKRSLIINILASGIALVVVTVLGLMLKMQVGILMYVLTGAVMVAVLVLVSKDCLYRCLYARDTLTWQYWVGIGLMLAALALFLAASIVSAIWLMNLLLVVTVIVGVASGCWMKFCWLKSLELEINQEEGDEECVEEITTKYQEPLEEDQTVLPNEL